MSVLFCHFKRALLLYRLFSKDSLWGMCSNTQGFLKKSNTERKELSGSRALSASQKWGSRRCYSIKGVVGLEWLLLSRHEGLNGLCYFCNHPKHLLKPGKSFGFETAVLRGFISLECATKIGLCKAILGSVASKQSTGCSFLLSRVQQGDTRKRRSPGYWGCFGSPQDPASSPFHLRPFDALDAVTSAWLWNIFLLRCRIELKRI